MLGQERLTNTSITPLLSTSKALNNWLTLNARLHYLHVTRHFSTVQRRLLAQEPEATNKC